MAKLHAAKATAPVEDRRIAYFSMEIGLDPAMPTYSGGLGILAGDTIRSGADMKVPMVAVCLLHRKGYFYQQLDQSGWQTELPAQWVVEDFLNELPIRAVVELEGRPVKIRVWQYDVKSAADFSVPVYFLDTDLPENAESDRPITHFLYGGDANYRLRQEIILGVGGVRILRALGYGNIERFHMNEGHAAFLTMELLTEYLAEQKDKTVTDEAINVVRRQCVFTTHTPVAAGHDKFSLDAVKKVFGDHPAFHQPNNAFCCDGQMNMTYLALNLSHYVNGVAKKHGEISRHMFGHYVIDSITNGVHAATWVSPDFAELFDQHIPGWRGDNFSLRYALSIPGDEIWRSHAKSKRRLIEFVNRECNSGMDFDFFTIGFARRAAAYKRADLLFSDIARLKQIVSQVGPIQVVYAGKAHPLDQNGKLIIQQVLKAARDLLPEVKVVYLPNYDMELGRMITSGVDLWLNTPLPPMEASGTSGMKAALNAVPSLSVPDGWWIEGCIENITGWAIGEADSANRDNARDAQSLYQKLSEIILPMFYRDRDRYANIMSHCIALNGSFFNTQRMMQQYVLKAYFS